MKNLKILLLVILTIHLRVFCQEEKFHKISLEVDPSPFLFKGYSFSLKYAPKKLPRVAFMASVFSCPKFPNSMLKKTNRENGWSDMNIRNSYAFFAEIYIKKQGKGFYFGPALFYYNRSVKYQLTDKNIKFATLYPNLRVGYVWMPFRKVNLYINPWVNIGSEFNLDNKNSLNGVKYETNRVYYIAAIHLGYTINLK